MTNPPRPESRISSLEKRATAIEAQIEELHADTAEELKAIRQDIKRLDDGMMSSFKELGSYFELTEKAMATKDDISRLEDKMSAMKNEILDAMKQLLQQKSGE
jgi:hypothetical protein